MKTTIIFRGYGSDQSYQIDTVMTIQPHNKTIMSFADVDAVPVWVSSSKWYVQESYIFFIGNVANHTKELESRMVVFLKYAV